MNMNPEQHDELKRLIDAMCEDTITPAESERLEELLTSDESALEFYIESMWLHEGIARHSSGHVSKIDATQFQPNLQSNLDELSKGDDEMVTRAAQQKLWRETEPRSATEGRRDSSNRNSLMTPWLIGVAAASILLVAVAIWSKFGDHTPLVDDGNPKSPQPQLVENSDSNSPAILKTYLKTIASNDLKREELRDGTIVIARSGAKYQVDQPREITLKTGELYLIVAKSDQPFIVKTPEGQVLATGTRFTVSTGEESTTSAAVAQGQVVMKSSAGEIELGVGQQGTLTESEQPTRKPARRLSHLVNWAKEALKQDELLIKQIAPENGLIAIDPYGQNARLSLRKYNVDVFIEDGIARTTIDQTFFNHNPWNTEGTFYFPLPRDASVSRLAMYVFGQLNEGGMVSRQRGQEIYTDILYKRRDPALLEMMEGNMFKMRIFPLEGCQEKRIFLSYTQNLEELYGTMKYFFPMDHTEDIANQISIRVRVKDGAKTFQPGSSTHDLKTSVEGNDLVMEYSAEKIKPDQDFLLALMPKSDTEIETESKEPADEVHVAVCQHEGQNYLTTRLRPDLSGEHTPEPRQWIVLNDVSASRSRIDIQAQRHILKRLIEESDDDDTVFLMDLNTTVRNISTRPVNVRSDKVNPLLNHRPQRTIGATNLAAGFDAAQQIIREFEMSNPHLVYLGDGVATDGEKALAELPRFIPQRCKFVGIGVGKKVDSMLLEESANKTGGLYTTINPNEDIDWRVFDLIASMNTRRMSNIRVTLLDKNDQPLETIAYPSSSVITAGETLTVTALCDKKLPHKIQFSGNVDKHRVTKTTLVKDAKQNANYLPRLWAKLHIDHLLKSGMSNEEEIVALSKSFYVVTPFTSLIVLEDDAMYEEYNVERGRKDHWATYDAPKTIEVVKEPAQWNRWGWNWGEFEGEESKIDATTRPKTIQEIIDNIQVRIDAPFYLWNNQSPVQQANDSRHELYRICQQDADSDGSIARRLALSFLLSADRKESDRGSGTNASAGASKPTSVLGESKLRRLTTYLRDPQRDSSSRSLLKQHRFRGYYEAARRPKQLAFSSNSSLGHSPSTRLAPSIRRSYQQAISARMKRMERDIKKFNSQYSHDRWNTWEFTTTTSWDDGFLTDDNLQGLVNFVDGEVDNDGDGLVDSLNLLVTDLDGLSIATPLPIAFGNQGGGFGGTRWAESQLGLGFEALPLRFQRFEEANVAKWFVTDNFRYKASDLVAAPLFKFDDLDIAGRFAIPISPAMDQPASVRFFRLDPFGNRIGTRQRFNLNNNRSTTRRQPGLTAVLAADFLHQRLEALQKKSVLNEAETGERQAVEIALKNMDRVGAKLESSGIFWSQLGWSYQPQNHHITAPVIQTHSGYAWSYDLTRYADGLTSNNDDFFQEVSSQFGTTKPLGSIDDATRKLIDESRSRFAPVNVQLDKDAPLLSVGPNDRFAYSFRNPMYLTESFKCDGKQIVQSYAEIGLAAVRPTSDSRLAALRQMVPHMLEPADSMIQNFDVTLSDSDINSYTLKLTQAKATSDSDSEPKSKTESDSKTAPPESAEQDHWLIQFDFQGRILSRKLISNNETLLSVGYRFETNRVKLNWELKTNEKTSTGESGYVSVPLKTDDSTFSTKSDKLVFIEMPLKKPSFYRKKLNELKGLTAEEASEDAKKEAKDRKPVPPESATEAIQLLRHELISKNQNLNNNPWNGNHCQSIVDELFQLIDKANRNPRRGDLALVGSTGISPHHHSSVAKLVQDNEDCKLLSQFFKHRRNWQILEKEFANETGLVGHLANHEIAILSGSDKNYDWFIKRFEESPLALSAAANHHGQFKIDRLLELNKNPNWSGVALLLASTRCSDEAAKRELTKEFWTWNQELAKKKMRPFLTDPIYRILKEVDAKRTKEFLVQRLEQIKELDSIPQLMEFAEQVSVWEETKLADQAYAIAKTKLELDAEDVALMKRFAFANSLWAGKRHKAACDQFEIVMAELKENQISLSPSFCAAMARLFAQTGDHERSIKMEEQALELEHPHLPSAINLQAFRQRYQWLWNQYVAAVDKIKHGDSEREQKIEAIVQRATKTWDRWLEVDRDNADMPAKMAVLLKKAGRDAESWEYLSSTIDRRPRDASSYTAVGEFYRHHGEMAKCVRWLAEAPQWDTANPQWIFNYGKALKDLGRKSEANVQFRKIINGKWAPGLQQYIEQARGELAD